MARCSQWSDFDLCQIW